MNEAVRKLLLEAANALQWALGEIEMNDRRLIELGDPAHLVQSQAQICGLIWATNAMLACKAAIQAAEGER